MRIGLIMFGVIFLVLGILLYLVPMQEIKANTTTTNGDSVDNRISSANITVPIEWAYALGAIGLILFILGLAIPGSNKRNYSKKDSLVESRENIKFGDENKRRIIREQNEKYNSKRDKNNN